MTHPLQVLVVGATGSIGRLVVDEALRKAYAVRVLIRNLRRADPLPRAAERVVGDLTMPATLKPAVAGIDAIVFTHGSDGGGRAGAESVDYGGVRNILEALGGRTARIALMTAIGVTNRAAAYNRHSQIHDWKRRGERLVRASGLPYTIVRPGWFDYNKADQHRLVFLQGDRRWAGDPTDGVVAREQIAEVLVASISSASAGRKTFELVAEQGPRTTDLGALFAALREDAPDSVDGCGDTANMPLAEEPKGVCSDLKRLTARSAASPADKPTDR